VSHGVLRWIIRWQFAVTETRSIADALQRA
jgi:hypothetical protein